VRERDLLHFFVVDGQQHHRTLQRVGLIGKNIERAVVRIAPLAPPDLAKAETRHIGAPGKVE
jgi:hypothetical protein